MPEPANIKVYFVADTHFGAPPDSAAREADFVRWLDMVKADASHLFLLGDIFDFWFSYKYVVPRGFVRVLGKLAELADSGVEIHFFTGNHDMWVFDYPEKELGIKTHTQPTEFEIEGKRFLVGHGDGLTSINRSYNALKSVFASKLCQRAFAALHPWAGFTIAKKWSRSSRRKGKKNNKKQCRPNEVPVFCKAKLAEKPYDYFVFGHRHRIENETVGNGAQYYVIGEWIEQRNYAVFSNGKMDIHNFANN